MSKGTRLVLLVTALAVATACAAISRDARPLPGQSTNNVAKSSELVVANVAADASEGTIVIVPPGPSERKLLIKPPNALAGGDPVRLVLELQRELKRVGCYSQEIDGEWGPATRRAMKDLIDRTNAALPLDVPDPVLLALLQDQKRDCLRQHMPQGAGSRPGQSMLSPSAFSRGKITEGTSGRFDANKYENDRHGNSHRANSASCACFSCIRSPGAPTSEQFRVWNLRPIQLVSKV